MPLSFDHHAVADAIADTAAALEVRPDLSSTLRDPCRIPTDPLEFITFIPRDLLRPQAGPEFVRPLSLEHEL